MTRREALILAAAAAATATVSTPAFADDQTIVQVSMWDTGIDAMNAFDLSKPIMLGTPGVAYKDSAPMGLTPDKYVVPAGEIEFVATNDSKEIEHEMLIVPITDLTKPLPYDAEIQRFDEDAAGAIGEVHETEPGNTGSVTLILKPGIYMLACNVANHYAMGMWTLITVV
jgi:uncharacterized cupredoxin-like copper-binding protein